MTFFVFRTFIVFSQNKNGSSESFQPTWSCSAGFFSETFTFRSSDPIPARQTSVAALYHNFSTRMVHCQKKPIEEAWLQYIAFFIKANIFRASDDICTDLKGIRVLESLASVSTISTFQSFIKPFLSSDTVAALLFLFLLYLRGSRGIFCSFFCVYGYRLLCVHLILLKNTAWLATFYHFHRTRNISYVDPRDKHSQEPRPKDFAGTDNVVQNTFKRHRRTTIFPGLILLFTPESWY